MLIVGWRFYGLSLYCLKFDILLKFSAILNCGVIIRMKHTRKEIWLYIFQNFKNKEVWWMQWLNIYYNWHYTLKIFLVKWRKKKSIDHFLKQHHFRNFTRRGCGDDNWEKSTEMKSEASWAPFSLSCQHRIESFYTEFQVLSFTPLLTCSKHEASTLGKII